MDRVKTKPHASRTKKARSSGINEQLFRRIFIVVFIGMVATVILGLGPVWLSAEATRAAQHSQMLKEDIALHLSVSESLEMQRSAAINDLRLNQTKMQDLGLVRSDGAVTHVELNSAEQALSSQLSLTGGVIMRADTVAYLASQGLTESQALADEGDATDATTSFDFNLADVVQNALVVMAQLTAGEASTLLVGDVGLAGMR